MRLPHAALGLVLLALPARAPAQQAPEGSVNDYPTATRADYVFGCMAANGQTREALERCSCSIDVIASEGFRARKKTGRPPKAQAA